MKLVKSSFYLAVIFFLSLTNEAKSSNDTRVLTLEEFYYHIVQNHPVARQAALLSEQARQELRIARGMFDPTINTTFYRKVLGGANYFTLWDNTLRIPIWFLDINAEYDRNVGFNVSGENFTTAAGITSLGLSLPVGQGLLIDQRRATLRQAQLLGDLAEAERVDIINRLLLDATNDYWDWVYAYNLLQLNHEGLELAEFRLRAVKERVREGYSRAIDTVEAKMQVQNRQVMLSQSRVDYQNASLQISNYLWTGDEVPLEITEQVIPGTLIPKDIMIGQDSLENLLVEARLNHPELRRFRLNRRQLVIERRLLADRLKPNIRVAYNVVQIGFPVTPDVLNFDYLANNYRFWVGFSFPLFLRAERGRLQLNNLRIRELELNQQQTEREILNRVQAYYNEIQTLRIQLYDQENLVENAQILRNSEQNLFMEGESSLFLINTREMDMIAQQARLFELQTRYAKSTFRLQWAAGTVPY